VITKSQIKFIKGLSLKKNRSKHECFVVEGEKSVSELLASNLEIIHLYATDAYNIQDNSAKMVRITNNELLQISSLKSPNNVLAIVRKPKLVDVIKDGIILVLDNINDPGNLGTIIRLCDWFGVMQIVCSKETVDIYNPKVIQSSMGSIFRVNVIYVDLKDYLKKVNTPIYGAFIGGSNIKNLEFPKDLHLLIGNESNGISEELFSLITKRVGIKNIGLQAESLNVAMATSIILYELSDYLFVI